MRIFVTGATGYLGYHFVNVAVAQGHKILCLRRLASKSLFDVIVENQIKWIDAGDNNLKTKIAEFEPDVLVHCAWGGVRGIDRNSSAIQEQNLLMSKRIYEIYPYKQIIALGSQAEYGYYSSRVSEDYVLNPNTEYGKAKVKLCNMLKHYCESNGIEWQWIRIFTVFGEKQTGGLIKSFAHSCLNHDIVFKTSPGMQIYSYLYSYDFGRALCQILGAKNKSGIYNLSQPFSIYSNRDLLNKIKEYLHSNIKIIYGAVPYGTGQIMIMDGTVSKFESTFGNVPYTDFDKALALTLDSIKNESF